MINWFGPETAGPVNHAIIDKSSGGRHDSSRPSGACSWLLALAGEGVACHV